MTNLCGGGPSQALPNVGPVLTLGAVAVEAFISGLGFPEVAPVIAPIIGAFADIAINNYCGTDPPADPGLTAQDIADAISVPPNLNSPAAINKVVQWFESRYWWQVCECSGVATPPPPTLSNPGGASQSPGLPSGQNAGPCWSVNFSTLVVHSGTGTFVDMPGGVPGPITGTWRFPGNASSAAGNVSLATIPNGATAVSWSESINQWVGGGQFGLLDIQMPFLNAAGTWLSYGNLASFQPSGSLSQSGTIAIPSGAVAWGMFASESLQSTTDVTLTTHFQFNCQAGTPLSTPCCPPDPLIEGYLRQILALLQAPPPSGQTGYTPGTVHTGLTGAGTFTFTDKVGFLVDITSGVPTNPQLPGTPPYEFSVGWMSVSDGAGMIDEKRITRQHQVWLSSLTPYATVFGYYLNPGFTINVTELNPK